MTTPNAIVRALTGAQRRIVLAARTEWAPLRELGIAAHSRQAITHAEHFKVIEVMGNRIRLTPLGFEICALLETAQPGRRS